MSYAVRRYAVANKRSGRPPPARLTKGANLIVCRLTIPLLWEDPFLLPTRNYRCIKTYFCFLNEDDKARFNEYGINDNLFLTNPLFNYPSFIKYLDISKICHSIEYWVDTLVDKSDNRLGHLVYRLLFEVFIENEGNLHSFEVVHPSILQEVFDQLNVLESIHILYCDSLNSDFVQQIIRIIKPFKLRSLFTKEIILNDHIESLLLLLQKFSDCLENFGFENGDIGVEYNEQKQKLFEFIMKYCKNIRYFYSCLPYYDNNSIYLFIEKNQHNINHLTIEGDFIENHILYAESSTLLRNLGQVLPSRLEYLCLTLSFIASDLEIFLKNSQNTFIKKLLINNVFLHTSSPRSVDTKILFFIKKYIMKKERVKYLAILESDSNGGIQPVELFFLKDEVNEYKLHNIIVQQYNDLYIDAHSYINYHLQY
ncbi:unnamed protein product [Rhizophagus irregularis]|nr:unnamed protein product [Rhizophagus irregularis]